MQLQLMSVFALMAAVSADRLDNVYLPPKGAQSSEGFLSAPPSPLGGGGGGGGGGRVANLATKVAATNSFSGGFAPTGAPIGIVRYVNENSGDGTYKFEYETENRISQQESGQLKNAGTDQESSVVQGSYSYVGPDGVTYTITYIADENGFQAIGDHIPTPPPTPEAILKSLEINAAAEAAGPAGSSGQYQGHSQGQGSGIAANRYQSSQGQVTGAQYIPPSAGNSGYRY